MPNACTVQMNFPSAQTSTSKPLAHRPCFPQPSLTALKGRVPGLPVIFLEQLPYIMVDNEAGEVKALAMHPVDPDLIPSTISGP